jgi:hypothetical protein
MIQTLQVVIANEVKQSHGIAASSRQSGTPRNDHILVFRCLREAALWGGGISDQPGEIVFSVDRWV